MEIAANSTITLAATDATPPITTYYTVDGSFPTTASAQYTAPLTITKDMTLRFFSKDGAGNMETAQSLVLTLPVKPMQTLPNPFRVATAVGDTDDFIAGSSPIYKSTAGGTWALVQALYVNSMATIPGTTIVFATTSSTTSPQQLHRSTAGGAPGSFGVTFTTSAIAIRSVACAKQVDSNGKYTLLVSEYVGTGIVGFRISKDNGVSFSTVLSDTSLGSLADNIANIAGTTKFCCANNAQSIVLETSGSTPTVATTAKTITGISTVLSICSDAAGNLYAAGTTAGVGVISKSTDEAVSWQQIATLAAVQDFNGIACAPDGTSIIAVGSRPAGAGEIIYRYDGSTWTQVFASATSGKALYAVASGDTAMVAVGTDRSYRSTDNGETWPLA